MRRWWVAAGGLLAAVAFVGLGLKMVGAAIGLLVLGGIVGTMLLWSLERPGAG
jgi:hypothetical protein